MVGDGEARSIGALSLLEESELRWGVEPANALRGDDTVDARHRRRLVLEALRAYDDLRSRQAPHLDPLTVFNRWPACTLVALTALAAGCVDLDMFRERLDTFLDATPEPAGRPVSPGTAGVRFGTWLRAWTACWRQAGRTGFSRLGPSLAADVPGLSLLLAAGRVIDRPEAESETEPEVRLDADSGSLSVALPGNSGEPWEARADGVSYQTFHQRWHIPRPVRSVDCTDLFGRVCRLPLVDPDDPLLVFDERGCLVPAGEALPDTCGWLLHPGELPDDAFDGDRRVLLEAVPPPGWDGWWLALVALDQTRAVRSHVNRDGHVAAAGPWRLVSRAVSLRLDLEPPIEGLFDADDRPVYARPPRVVLPAGVWTVQVSRVGSTDSTEPLFTSTFTGNAVVDLAEHLPHPTLGRFQIRVRGDARRGLREDLTLAEDLVVRAEPRLRMLTGTGELQSAAVSVQVGPAMSVHPNRVSLGRHDTGRMIAVSTGGVGGRTLEVRVQPPYTALRRRTATETGPWGIAPLDLTIDGLAGLGIDLRLPAAAAPGSRLRLAAGQQIGDAVQSLDGRRLRGGELFRYDLAALTDTVRHVGALQVWLDLTGELVQVATVRAAAPASGVRRDGNVLTLVDRRSGGRLGVCVHAVFAPWLPPQRVELSAGRDTVALVPPFQRGPLLVTVGPAESSTAVDGGWPTAGVRGSTRAGDLLFETGNRSEIPVLTDPVEQAVALSLATGQAVPDAPTALPFVWAAAARPDWATLTPPDDSVQSWADHLGSDPTASLFAAARTGLPETELVTPLIRSGLAAAEFRAVSDPERVLAVWASAPLPALLLTSPVLPYLCGTSDWDRAELEAAEQGLLAEVGHHFGPVALDLLAGCPLSEPGTGGFGAEPGRLERWAPSRLDAAVRALRLLPRWPLDADNRLLAALHAFAVRDGLRDIPEELAEYLEAVRLFGSHPSRAGLFDLLAGRGVPEGVGRAEQWQLVPVLSLGFALVARLAAQGGRTAAALERQTRPVWARLAAGAPELVAKDLQLAEFLVCAWQVHHRM